MKSSYFPILSHSNTVMPRIYDLNGPMKCLCGGFCLEWVKGILVGMGERNGNNPG